MAECINSKTEGEDVLKSEAQPRQPLIANLAEYHKIKDDFFTLLHKLENFKFEFNENAGEVIKSPELSDQALS